MTFERDTHVPTDNGIGLIAISRHQGFWYHTPNSPFLNQPNNPLGVGTSRWNRYPLVEQLTGHTAVFSRVGGVLNFARGFVPRWYGYIGAFLGSGGAGTWQDDIHMTNDPTCIGFEIPVTAAEATQFTNWFLLNSPTIDTYSLTGGNAVGGGNAAPTFNCVLAATTILVNYFADLNNPVYRPYIEQLLTIDSSGQGPLMRRIFGGFQ